MYDKEPPANRHRRNSARGGTGPDSDNSYPNYFKSESSRHTRKQYGKPVFERGRSLKNFDEIDKYKGKQRMSLIGASGAGYDIIMNGSRNKVALLKDREWRNYKGINPLRLRSEQVKLYQQKPNLYQRKINPNHYEMFKEKPRVFHKKLGYGSFHYELDKSYPFVSYRQREGHKI